jgi:hypothetical protein
MIVVMMIPIAKLLLRSCEKNDITQAIGITKIHSNQFPSLTTIGFVMSPLQPERKTNRPANTKSDKTFL